MSTEFSPSNPPEVFISYAHEDDRLKERFVKHLAGLERQGVIVAWHDHKIAGGDNWQKQTDKHLKTAEIVVLLVSANFLASGYAYGIEFKRAMQRHRRREARVIPIILSPCDWKDTPLGELQALPQAGKPIVQWRPIDAGFANVAEGLKEAIKQLSREERLRESDYVITTEPVIQVTEVPSKGAGPDVLESIAGTVSGVTTRDCKVVIFARTNTWYVQPYIDSSDTLINDDGTWRNDTHLGLQYAALLVKTAYQPPATTGKLPSVGGLVLAVATADARQ